MFIIEKPLGINLVVSRFYVILYISDIFAL